MHAERKADGGVEALPRLALAGTEQVSLCEVLDRILDTGVVATGGITISVADVDLIYLGLNAILASVETAFGASVEGFSETSGRDSANQGTP